MPELVSFFHLKLCKSLVLGDSREIGVDEGIWVSLATDAGPPAVVEARREQHLPNLRVAPIVRILLGEYADPEIIVSTLKHGRNGPPMVPIEHDHVLFELLEGIIERHLVIASLAFSKADHTLSIADKDENTPLVNSVQSRYIGHTV